MSLQKKVSRENIPQYLWIFDYLGSHPTQKKYMTALISTSICPPSLLHSRLMFRSELLSFKQFVQLESRALETIDFNISAFISFIFLRRCPIVLFVSHAKFNFAKNEFEKGLALGSISGGRVCELARLVLRFLCLF